MMCVAGMDCGRTQFNVLQALWNAHYNVILNSSSCTADIGNGLYTIGILIINVRFTTTWQYESIPAQLGDIILANACDLQEAFHYFTLQAVQSLSKHNCQGVSHHKILYANMHSPR